MADKQQLRDFLEKEFGNPSDSSIMQAIAALMDESKSIQADREKLEQRFQMQFKQRSSIIDRQYQSKVAALRGMMEKMNSGSLTKDDILNLRVAIEELLQLLDLKKEKELKALETTLEERNQKVTDDFEAKSEQKMQACLDTIGKKVDELGVLENNYETASFNSPIWNNLTNKSKFPEVNSIRLGEKQITFNDGDKPYSFDLPQIVPFFAKKSLLITYNAGQRNQLKVLLDSIMVRCLMSAEAGNTLFYLMDGDGYGDLFYDYLNCNKNTLDKVFNGKIIVTPADIERALVDLQLKYQDVDQKERKGIPVEKYNEMNPQAPIFYRFVVMDHFPGAVSPEYARMIMQLMKYETDAGLHFIFLVDNNEAGRVQEIANSPYVQCVSFENAGIKSFDPSLVSKTLQCIDQMIDEDKAMRFEDYYEEHLKDLWTESSVDGISIPLGTIRAKNFNLTYSGQTAHAIISGSTSCGKSSMLHSMIMGACLRYSPDELRFILVDAKNVEFKIYAEAYLPHADIVALKADPIFGLHVLELVEKKLHERQSLFGCISATSIEEYRRRRPDEIVPRYLVLIDEYQELFKGDMGREVERKLSSLLAQCRAFGIHIILSSQNVKVWGDEMNNISIRMAMKSTNEVARNTLDVSTQLAESLVRGQFIFRILGPQHLDVVTSYFLPKPFADPNPQAKTINDYLERIQEKWLEGWPEQRMLVFDQETHALLNNNIQFNQLKPGNYNEILFSPGERVMIDGTDVMCKFTNEKDQNLLVIGGKREVSVRTLNGIIMSMTPQFDQNVKMDILNLAQAEENRIRMEALSNGNTIRYSEDDQVLGSWLDEIIEDMKTREETKCYNPRFLVLYCMENCASLKKSVSYAVNFDGSKRPVLSKSSSTEKLLHILQNGSEKGVHCLLHFAYTDACTEVFDIAQSGGDKDLFNHRVLLQMDARFGARVLDDYDGKPAQDLVDTRLSEEFQYNFALYFNKFSKERVKIKPYAYYDKSLNL